MRPAHVQMTTRTTVQVLLQVRKKTMMTAHAHDAKDDGWDPACSESIRNQALVTEDTAVAMPQGQDEADEEFRYMEELELEEAQSVARMFAFAWPFLFQIILSLWQVEPG